MKLGKPPIIEMWISFSVPMEDPTAFKQAAQFVAGLLDEYPHQELTAANELKVREISPTRLPKVVGRRSSLRRLKASNDDGTRWLQIAPGDFVCNFVKLGEGYPGFTALRDEALSRFGAFVQACRPTKLTQAAIHYIDLIEIPCPVGTSINLSDYFVLGVDLPIEPFGVQGYFAARTVVSPPDGTGLLDIDLSSALGRRAKEGTREEVLRFRIEWHKHCPYDGEIDMSRIAAALDKAHVSVMRAFEASFRSHAWSLFERED